MPSNQELAGQTQHQLLPPGAVFHGRYEVVRCIKAGGMGAVYEVTHREVRRRQALKTMLPSLVSDPDMRARFRLEASVASQIESEHIVQVFDAGVDDETGLPFLVMELLRGASLGAELERRGRFSGDEVVTLLNQASLALDRTHAAGIIHRDLKPENLFLASRDDGTPLLKLLDFGIAKVVAEGTQPNTTRSFGTPLYMSPEQIRGDGDIGLEADLYSLGQIAFTLLVGRAYWEAESRRSGGVYSLLLKVMEGPAEAASVRAKRLGAELPESFDAWFVRATALEPSDRFGSASELVQELARVLSLPVPRSTRRAGIEVQAAISAEALAPTLKSTAPGIARTPVRDASGDSTGALSSAGRVAQKATRRKGLLWVAVVVAVGAVVALLARPVDRVEQAPARVEPQRASAPVPTPEGAPSGSAAAPGAELAPSASTGAPKLPAPANRPRAAGVRPKPSASVNRRPYDPTDIR